MSLHLVFLYINELDIIRTNNFDLDVTHYITCTGIRERVHDYEHMICGNVNSTVTSILYTLVYDRVRG